MRRRKGASDEENGSPPGRDTLTGLATAMGISLRATGQSCPQLGTLERFSASLHGAHGGRYPSTGNSRTESLPSRSPLDKEAFP